MSASRFNSVKVFFATMFRDRAVLGEKVTSWLTSHPDIEISDLVVTQSSDRDYHCISITVFFWAQAA